MSTPTLKYILSPRSVPMTDFKCFCGPDGPERAVLAKCPSCLGEGNKIDPECRTCEGWGKQYECPQCGDFYDYVSNYGTVQGRIGA